MHSRDANHTRSLVAIIACVAVYGLIVGFTTPLVSIILEQRGLSRSMIGLVAVMPSLSMILFAPLIPRLATRTGLRRFIIAALLVEALLILLFVVFEGLVIWMVLRFLMGMTLGSLFVVAETWINAIAEEHRRARIVATYSSVFFLSMALGPALIVWTGTEGFLPFAIAAACALAGIVPLAWASESSSVMEGSVGARDLVRFARNAPGLAAAVALFAIVEIAIVALLPVYCIRSGTTAAEAAVMLTALGMGRVLIQVPIGKFADRFDRHQILVACIAVTGLCTLLVPWAVTGGLAGLLLLILWGGSLGGIYTLALTLVGQGFRGVDLICANAAIAVIWGACGILGPAASGVAMDIWDPHGLIVVLAIACLAGLIYVSRAPRHAPSPIDT